MAIYMFKRNLTTHNGCFIIQSSRIISGDVCHKVVEVVPGALASSPALLGGGGGADPGSAIARSGAEADTPEARALGKRAVSPVGSVAAEAMQLPPQRTEGAPGSVEGQPVSMDTEAMPLPPPPPSQRKVAVPNRLQPRSR